MIWLDIPDFIGVIGCIWLMLLIIFRKPLLKLLARKMQHDRKWY
jgi:hypothetical protein